MSGFFHERVLEGRSVGVKRGGFDAELFANFAPAGDGGCDFGEDGFGVLGLESKTGGGGERSGDGGLVHILGNRSFGRLRAVDLRHGIHVVSWRGVRR